MFSSRLPNALKVLKHISMTDVERTGKPLATISNRNRVYPVAMETRKQGIARVLAVNKPMPLETRR